MVTMNGQSKATRSTDKPGGLDRILRLIRHGVDQLQKSEANPFHTARYSGSLRDALDALVPNSQRRSDLLTTAIATIDRPDTTAELIGAISDCLMRGRFEEAGAVVAVLYTRARQYEEMADARRQYVKKRFSEVGLCHICREREICARGLEDAACQQCMEARAD